MAEYVFKIDGEIKACHSDVYSQDGYCPFHFYAFNGGSHCSISNCKCTKTKRPEGCPLVEVPPHGRLGDLDALTEHIRNVYCKNCKRSKVMCKACEYGDILDEIEEVPTILEASR